MVVVRPWSLFDDSMTPFAAVAHAYEGLFELETVRYRVDGTNSTGNEFEELHQVDMVNRIEYSVLEAIIRVVPDLAVGDTLREESLIINGKYYIRRAVNNIAHDFGPEDQTYESSESGWVLFRGVMNHPEEDYPWTPFGDLGGLPWSRERAEDWFDNVDLVGNTEVDGQPAVHYRASRSSVPDDESDLHTIVNYMFGREWKTYIAESRTT